ncbi:MAG: S8 family serine peptidase, partial [Acidobacteriota bacterium]
PYQLLIQCFLAAGIYRTAHDGNDIISISASGASVDPDYLREACQYAYSRNCVLISGALYSRWFKQGNTRNFPGQYKRVVSVTAAQKKPDGSYGYWDACAAQETNTIAAPNDIFGAFPTYAGKEDTYMPSISAAIPVVSSLFALLVSVHPKSGAEAPGEYAQLLMDLVIKNASPERVGFKGFSPECGHGLIDAEKTVRAALELKAKL